MPGGATSFSMKSISWFFRFISVPSNIFTSAGNNPTASSRALVLDSIPFLVAFYFSLNGLLIGLIGLKYKGFGDNPFEQHYALMVLFLIAISIFVIVLITFRSDQTNDQFHSLKLVGCHISGSIACELLLLVLVSPMRWLITNASLGVAATLVLGSKHILRPRNTETTQISETHHAQELAIQIQSDAGGN